MSHEYRTRGVEKNDGAYNYCDDGRLPFSLSVTIACSPKMWMDVQAGRYENFQIQCIDDITVLMGRFMQTCMFVFKLVCLLYNCTRMFYFVVPILGLLRCIRCSKPGGISWHMLCYFAVSSRFDIPVEHNTIASIH